MRWHFYDPFDPIEAREHEETLRRIDAWWAEFARRVDDLKALFTRKKDWDLPAWMHERLQGICPELMWEFGPAVRTEGHRLVITPEGERHLRPLVGAILERAPKIAGWEFYPYRIAEDLDWAMTTVIGRTGVDMKDARVELRPRDDQKIDVRYMFAACRSPEDDDAMHAAFVATESLLGEPLLDRWVGTIEVAPHPKKSLFAFRREPGGIPIAEMPSRMKQEIDAVVATLPQGRCVDRRDAEWAMWELRPPQGRNDYPAQSDMLLGKSMYPEMWMATRAPQPFYSDVYSRSGETFCYLKLDGSEGLDEEHFADKGEVEDAIDAALREAGVGCFVGGGTGLRYSYLDLALDDIERGAEIVRGILRGGNIAKRSWLLFHDAELAGEWIGVWGETPRPPE